MASERISGFCTLCRSRCGTLNTVEHDRLVRVEPDPSHPTGHAMCSKGRAAPEIAHGTRRLATPLRRTRPKTDPNPGWEPVGWDEALADIAARLEAQKVTAGAESVAFAVTSPSGTPISDAIDWIERFIRLFGSPNTAYSTEICNWHKDHAHAFTYGAGIGTPDYARADLILLWGHNPSAVWLAQADAIARGLRNGAKLVVVDPRRTPHAGQADHWLQVRPGTDAALAMGIIRQIIATEAYDDEFVRRWTNAPYLVRADDGSLLRIDGAYAVLDEDTGRAGPVETVRKPALRGSFRVDGVACRTAFEALAEACEPFDPARVEALTTVPEAALRNTAAAIAQARAVSYYCWTGVGQHADATQTDRAIAILTALTGTYDVPGGNRDYARQPTNKVNPFDLLHPAQAAKALGLPARPLGPPAQGWVTAADLYAAILERRPYAVRALVSFGANLVVSHADPGRAEAALSALDFHVHCDLFETPTGRFADYLLPVNSPWEREGLRVGFEIDETAEELVQLRPRMVPPLGQSRSDMDIVFDLAVRLGLGDKFFGGDIDAAWDHVLAPLNLTVAELRQSPAGIRRTIEQVPQRYASRAKAFATETGRIELYSERLLRHGYSPLPTCSPAPEAPDVHFPFVLTTANSGYYCHSQQRGVVSLRRRAPEPTASMSQSAAKTAGISEGDWVRLRSRVGSARFRARVDPELHPDVVVADYGWWQACPDLALPGFAAADPLGSNYNALISADHSDPISGSVPMRSFACSVERDDATAMAGWCALRVDDLVREAHDVVSVTLISDGGVPLPDYLPGQHLPIRLEGVAGGRTVERSYSLSGPATATGRSSYRITVKRVPGGVSSEHITGSLSKGDAVWARRPAGRFSVPVEADFPVVMLAAGIGVTPFIAALETLAVRSAADRRAAASLVLHYGCRNGASHAFRARLLELRRLLPTLEIVTHYSQPEPSYAYERDFDRVGRIQPEDVPADLIAARARFYLCGPPAMLRDLEGGLVDRGVPRFEIFQEAFVASPAALPTLAARQVTFRRSERTLLWRPGDGTLLELAEGQGLALPSGCRVGTCESCAVPVVSGTIHYMAEIGFEGLDSCLTCRAVPGSDLVLDA